jgi:predicted SprT family Zn-dependent metalloprotease
MKPTKVQKLGNKLIRKWDLDFEWSFELNNAKKRFGVCKCDKGIIGISKPLAVRNDVEQVKDVILHEIAHALDWEERGDSDHSQHWKAWARKVGADPDRCYDPDEVVGVDYDYFHWCANCGHKYGRYRRNLKDELYTCGKCDGHSFDLDHILVLNIPTKKMDQIENETLNWRTLPQTHRVLKILNGKKHFQQKNKFVKAVGKKECKVALNGTDKESKINKEKHASLSNKGKVYKAWEAGEHDPGKLWDDIGRQVRKTTIQGWISGWKNGKRLPAMAKK